MRSPVLVSLVVILIILSTNILQAQENSGTGGTIMFTDGTRTSFTGLKSLMGYTSGLRVEYQNSTRTIPFDKMKSFEVLDYDWVERTEIQGAIAEYKMTNVRVKVTTTAGVSVETAYANVGPVTVKIFDELTGEIIEQTYYLGTIGQPNRSLNRLLIRAIVFGR